MDNNQKTMIEIFECVNNVIEDNEKRNDLLKRHIQNADAWIKHINNRLTDIEGLHQITEENSDNIQHNYEIIYELKDEIEELKQEISALKLVQIIMLRKGKYQEHRAKIYDD